MLQKRLKFEYRIGVKHLGITAYAALLGMTVNELKQAAEGVQFAKSAVWKHVSDEVARAVFDDFLKNREVAVRFASKHQYSATGLVAMFRERWPDEYEAAADEKRPEHARLYKIGRDFERRIRLQLLAAGYYVVRSAGSKTPVDLTAIKDGLVLLVQCKRNGALPPAEWNALLDVADITHGVPVLVEHPHAGQTNWWKLETRKNGRGTGTKSPFPAPNEWQHLSPEEIEQLAARIDDEDAEDESADAASLRKAAA